MSELHSVDAELTKLTMEDPHSNATNTCAYHSKGGFGHATTGVRYTLQINNQDFVEIQYQEPNQKKFVELLPELWNNFSTNINFCFLASTLFQQFSKETYIL